MIQTTYGLYSGSIALPVDGWEATRELQGKIGVPSACRLSSNTRSIEPLNAFGKVTVQGGEIQEGDFKDGRLVNGKVTFKDQIDEGEWGQDRRLNKGKITFTDGETQEGDYKDGELDGKGKATFKNGEIQEGDFKKGRLDGNGKATSPDGQVQEGNFKDGHVEGHGTYTPADPLL